MTGFETRVQGLGETEDEYMLALIKLFKAANPDAKTEDINRAVKRKFLNGISDDLRRNLFIFCNNPLEETVSHSDLLQASNKARVHLSSGTARDGFYAGSAPGPDDPTFVNVNVKPPSQLQGLLHLKPAKPQLPLLLLHLLLMRILLLQFCP